MTAENGTRKELYRGGCSVQNLGHRKATIGNLRCRIFLAAPYSMDLPVLNAGEVLDSACFTRIRTLILAWMLALNCWSETLS